MIPTEEYKEIVKILPILCVDLIVRRGDMFLLVKRRNEPLAGEWWVPGGRLFRGESVYDAAKRILREEVGITEFHDFNAQGGIYQEVFDKGACGPIHTVSVICEVFTDSDKVVLDEQSDDFMWTNKLPDKFKHNA